MPGNKTREKSRAILSPALGVFFEAKLNLHREMRAPYPPANLITGGSANRKSMVSKKKRIDPVIKSILIIAPSQARGANGGMAGTLILMHCPSVGAASATCAFSSVCLDFVIPSRAAGWYNQSDPVRLASSLDMGGGCRHISPLILGES